MMNHLSLFILFFLSFPLLKAQSMEVKKKPFPFAETLEMHSQALKENRELNIWLPHQYDPDSARNYPVVYVLDGSVHEDFQHIAGLVQFMNMYDIMPKSIVVGIANVDRYRDFTHPTNSKEDLKNLPTGGGSEKFIRFVKEEVQPFIEANYQSNGHKTIIGQSMGGLLAAEILLIQPQLFDDYIIVSPSLWWDDQSLVNGAADHLKAHSVMKKKVFVSLGKEHPVMHEVADKLVDAIKGAGNEQISLFYEPILEEDHATILHKAVYKAFEMLNKKAE